MTRRDAVVCAALAVPSLMVGMSVEPDAGPVVAVLVSAGTCFVLCAAAALLFAYFPRLAHWVDGDPCPTCRGSGTAPVARDD